MIIKICGMREADNIRDVEALAPDWMGFICWEKSSRYVSAYPAYLPTHCQRVGVFVNPSSEYLLEKTRQLQLDRIQLHGSETPDFCRRVKAQTGIPLLKAFSISNASDFTACAAYEGIAAHFLFDTKCPTVGGSGKAFDWSLLDGYHGHTPFILAGGIGPDSVEAIRSLSLPLFAGIDLNSRFETAPARKDVQALSNFLVQLKP